MSVRKEKKYTFSVNDIDEVRSYLLNSDIALRPAYENRYVNSIYLDSINFDNYNENLIGLSKRTKARIRWYSRGKCQRISSDTEFTLELKLRSNFLSDKLSYPFKLPHCGSGLTTNELINYLRTVIPIEFLPFIDHCNDFTLAVSYLREYYEDFSRKIRCTLDSKITFSKPLINILDVKTSSKYLVEYGVLELKYPSSVEKELSHFKLYNVEISPGRHSKYAVGVNIVSG